MNHHLAVATIVATVVACGVSDSQVAAPSQTRSTFRRGDVELAYLLDRPATRGPHPAVVIGHGSGRVLKEDQGELAAAFLNAGYAVLRYDKRGVGESGGIYSGVGTANSATMFPVPEATFGVIFSGPTVSGGLEIYYSDLAEHGAVSPADAEARLADYRGPHGFDPLPYLERLEVPVLWLFGAEDRSIPTKRSVEILTALARDRYRRFKWAVYPEAGHRLDLMTVWPDVRSWLTELAR